MFFWANFYLMWRSHPVFDADQTLAGHQTGNPVTTSSSPQNISKMLKVKEGKDILNFHYRELSNQIDKG